MTIPTLRYLDTAKDKVPPATIPCDLERLIVSRALIQGVSGSGKSSALRALLEQTYGRVQHLVIDRDGEFATLREKFPYLLVGPDGDVPASPKSAALLTRRVVELGASAIVDLSEMKLPDQRAWVRRSFEELISLPRSLWRPLIVGLDEGHLFCPEQDKAESREAVIGVATLGRKRGFCLVVATQRLSKLDKDAAAELQNKIIGFTDDVDVRRAVEQLGMNTADRQQLRTLEPGQFFVKGPAISRSPVLATIGQTLTQAPPRGQARPPMAPAPKAIQQLAAQLADLPKQAEEETRSIEELQRRLAEKDRKIRELERAKPKAPEAKVEIRTKEIPVDRPVPFIPQEEFKAVIDAAALLNAACGTLAKAAKKAPPKSLPVLQVANASGFSPGGDRVRISGAHGTTVIPRARALDRRAETESFGSLSKAERSVLRVLAQYPEGRTVVQVALLTNYAHSGGGFRNALGSLRSKGLISGDAERLTITDEGTAAAGDVQPLPTGRELLDQWKRQSSKAERLILEALADRAPDAMTPEEIAEVTGYEAGGGGFRNALGRLRTLEVIRGRGQIQLADELQ